MLDKVNVLDTLKVSNNVDTLKVLDVIGTLKVSSKIGTLKVSSKLGTLKVSSKMNTLKVLNKLGTIEVSQQGYLLEKCNVLARGMVKEEWCGPMGWEVRYHLMGLQDKVGRLEDWEVRYQFKGLTSCKRLDTIEESAVMDPQGLKLMCKRLDTIEESAVMDPQGLKEMCKRLDATEESVMVMDLNDVKFKAIEQYQVVCEINLKDEVIGKMMNHPWKEFQWECNSMRWDDRCHVRQVGNHKVQCKVLQPLWMMSINKGKMSVMSSGGLWSNQWLKSFTDRSLRWRNKRKRWRSMLRTCNASVMSLKRRMRSCRRSSRRRVHVWIHQGHHCGDLSTTCCHQEQPLEELKFRRDNHQWR